MGILLFIVFGFIVGLIARALMPGEQRMGFIGTTAIGVIGSFIGGFLASLFTHNRVTEFNTSGIIGSVIGAMVLLFAVSAFSRRRALA